MMLPSLCWNIQYSVFGGQKSELAWSTGRRTIEAEKVVIDERHEVEVTGEIDRERQREKESKVW